MKNTHKSSIAGLVKTLIYKIHLYSNLLPNPNFNMNSSSKVKPVQRQRDQEKCCHLRGFYSVSSFSLHIYKVQQL